MRDVVRGALGSIASRFSGDAPSVDDRALRARYRAMDAWPADAQLGLIVLAWVLGPGFSHGTFRRSVNSLVPDFATAAQSVRALGPNPTLVTLGGIARCAFDNGNVVIRQNLNPDLLYWPLDLSRCKM